MFFNQNGMRIQPSLTLIRLGIEDENVIVVMKHHARCGTQQRFA